MDGLHEDRLKEVITKAVGETIESMAFTTPEPASKVSPDPNGEYMAVEQHIVEPDYATLGLCMPKELGTSLVKTIYAVEEENTSDKMAADLAAELLNTITGSVIKELLADDTPFKLSIPEIINDHNQLSRYPFISFHVSGQPLVIYASLTPYM